MNVVPERWRRDVECYLQGIIGPLQTLDYRAMVTLVCTKSGLLTAYQEEGEAPGFLPFPDELAGMDGLLSFAYRTMKQQIQ